MGEVRLLDPCLREIGRVHDLVLRSYKTNVVVANVEVDVIAYYSTPSGYERTIVLELKETDFPRLVYQLFKRFDIGNYVYGAIALSPYHILQSNEWFRAFIFLRSYGIGLITCPKNDPQILLKAKYRKNPIVKEVIEYE
ncbi:hypothetical protein JdFRA1000001_30c [uncultured archaeal virus]|uniref:Uncharacterized protein n=1 Tax=uncultured archaeal virus TaxID=1960247 RepID=A0A1S5Y346_9VIRU|nr:hypothetical protein JdFRA1000001_30c [uncultured archaeal virus]